MLQRAPGAAVGSTDRGVGMTPSGVVRGGSARSRVTGGAGWQRGRVASGGVQEEERKVRQRGGGAPTAGLSQHSVGRRGSNSGLNRFKNIQMVQMKFEFLQTLASSKDTFRTPKI
jgi:hypothetical protein